MKQFKFSVFLFLIVGIAFLSTPDLQAKPKQDYPTIQNLPIDVTLDVADFYGNDFASYDITYNAIASISFRPDDRQIDFIEWMYFEDIPICKNSFIYVDNYLDVDLETDSNPPLNIIDLSSLRTHATSETAIGIIPHNLSSFADNINPTIEFINTPYDSNIPPGFTYSVITDDDIQLPENTKSLQVVNDTPTIRKL